MDFNYRATSDTLMTTSRTAYVRRMHGMERLIATAAEVVNGFGHLFMGYHVLFKLHEPSKRALEEMVRSAWIHTRFMAPWIAVRTAKAKGETNSWFQIYDSPTPADTTSVLHWADRTVIWRDESQPLDEWETSLKEKYWTPSDGRFGMELHLAKAPEGGYFIMASIGHWVADGRGSLQVIEFFFKNLCSQMAGKSISVDRLSWGDELERLSSATVEALDALPQHVKCHAELSKMASVPLKTSHNLERTRQFVRPLIEIKAWEHLPALQTHIKLSQEETSAFHHLCAARRANSTALISAINILADIETMFYIFRDHTDFQSVLNEYMEAEMYTITENMADRRSLLCKRMPSVSAPGGFGNNVCEVFPTHHSMEHIRSCVKMDSASRRTTVDVQSRHFWEGLVAETEKQLRKMKSTTPERFMDTETSLNSSVPFFNIKDHFAPGVLCSSIGRLSSLGLFKSFLPSVAGREPSYPFVIQDVAIGTRATGPDVQHVAVMSWEYNGRMTISLGSSPRWHSDKAWRFFEQSIRDSLKKLLASSAKL